MGIMQEYPNEEFIKRQQDYLNEDLSRAILEKKIDRARALCSVGADVNGVFSCGMTMLMYSAICATLDTIKFLVEKGADVYARDDRGDNAATYAHRLNRVEIQNYLYGVMDKK